VARAGILITGTEVLSGRVSDRNGPWLSQRLRGLGIDLIHHAIVGDRREEMLAALRFMAAEGVDVIVTSGGLGPTADDLTAEVVGGFAGREMVLDEALEGRIAEILRPLLARWPHLDEEAIRISNRKQAVVPKGATVIDPVGTAPGLVVPPDGGDGPTVVVLPGPPRELQPMWRVAVETDAFRAATGGALDYREGMLRMFGIPESEIAASLRAIEEGGVDLRRLEITTCLRRGEIELVTRYEARDEAVYRALDAGIRARHGDTLFSDDGSTVDDQVARLLTGPPLRTIAVAESCTGGVGVRRWGRGRVRRRSEDRARRGRTRADRDARSRLPAGGHRAGRGGDRRVRRECRAGRDRRGGPGGRNRRQADRLRVLVRDGARWRLAQPCGQPARRAGGCARPLHHDGDAPAAAPAAWRARPGGRRRGPCPDVSEAEPSSYGRLEAGRRSPRRRLDGGAG
jgi:molybdenum cofactor synthesis domain-containing protein